jgi:hypothetical protein
MLIARSVHPLPGDAERKERLLSLIDGFANRRVLVVGDLIADEFIYGEVARVSREAPVLILKYDATETVAGGAGNAANNLAALGGRAALAGLVGTDAEGRRLLGSFHRGVDRGAVARAADYRTPVKTRILAGGVHSAKQQVVRIDRETGWPLAEGGAARSPAVRQATARHVRRGPAVRLRIGAGDARAWCQRPAAPRAALAPAPGAGARRFALPAARLSRLHHMHAQRIRARGRPGDPRE